jgi:hypothetical protein
MQKAIYKCFLTTTIMILTAAATPTWALDWRDPEWVDRGCPSKLSGDWIPLTDSPYAGSKIEFESNSASLSSKNSSVVFTLTPNSKDETYFNLKRLSGEPASFPGYLKIRPHIAVQSISKGKKYTLCKIKVFLFESKQKADQMSYLSWDIYSTIDSLEVPNGN